MKVAVPKEIYKGEGRVSVVPSSVRRMVDRGLDVLVEAGAGKGSFFSDSDYKQNGGRIETSVERLYRDADIILKLHEPMLNETLGRHEIDMMNPGSLLISFLYPLVNHELVKKLAEFRVTAFSMDAIPRTTVSQSMDALSSMSTIAGYRAVLIAANRLPKFFPMLMTAAGTVPPARVLVIGAGVAGLQACATAKRLGAVVEAFDQRPAVKEQVESLGVRFVEVPTEEEAETAGGYAKELSEEYKKRQGELIHKHIARADVVITTALIPGKRAPIIITGEMVEDMEQGSVIVDLASDFGGNCALTEPGNEVVKHGVTICGCINLPASMPVHASEMYSKNIENFLFHIIDNGNLKIDMEDVIIKGSLITRDGNVVHSAIAKAITGRD